MDCTKFEDLLFASLESPLDAADERILREHTGSCSRCRELAALLTEDVGTVSGETGRELLAEVLEATSGSVCDKACLRLAEEPGTWTGSDALLLSDHVASCPECARFADALARLRQDLPGLAEIDPGPAFAAGVMAATVGVEAPASGSVRSRLAALWERAAQRPRLALEAAYAGAAVAFLLFGLPSATWADLPARALEGIRQEGAHIERVVASGVDDLIESGRASWSSSVERASRFFDELADERSGDAARDGALRAWIGATRELVIGVWDHLILPLGQHLQSLWHGSSAGPEQPGSNP